MELDTGLLRQVVGDQFGMGIDDTHMKIRGAPVLDEPALSPHQKMIADKLAVSELMSMAVVALPPIVKVPVPLIAPGTDRVDVLLKTNRPRSVTGPVPIVPVPATMTVPLLTPVPPV